MVWLGEEHRGSRAWSAALLAVTGHWPRYGAGTIEVGKVEMAQKVSVVLEDDLTGGPAEQTIRFDGTDYEIDLNAKNAATFGKQLAPYIEHARRAGRAQPTPPRAGCVQPPALR